MRIAKWLKKKPSEAAVHYFALGDSISTDDYPGEHRGAASLFHKELQKLFPHVRFHCLALDGATSYDVLHHQLQHVHAVHGKAIVTLTAGGNDILSMQSAPEEICFRIRAIVDELLRKLHDCTVILGTVYDPSDGEADLFGPEHSLEKELQHVLEVNECIRNMANAQIRIADIYAAFLGHGSHCKNASNSFYHADDPSLWYVLDIEPNMRGAQEVCKLFLSAFEVVNAR